MRLKSNRNSPIERRNSDGTLEQRITRTIADKAVDVETANLSDHELLERNSRAYAAGQGITLIYDKTPAQMTWDELHAQRKAYRHLINSTITNPVMNAAGGGPLAQHRLDLVDHYGDCVKVISQEMDSRDLNNNREPRYERISRMLGGYGAGQEPRDGGDAKLGSGQRFVDLTTGREVRALGPKDSFASTLRGDYGSGSMTTGDFLAGIVTGRWRNPEHQAEARTMSIGSNAGGGYMIPSPLSAQFIDMARAQMQVQVAGATMIPMETKTLTLARNAGDPTAAWKAENAAGSFSDMTLERVTLNCQTVMAMVKLSNELFDDAPNIGQVIESSLSQSLALEMDRVCLEGSGTPPEPRGIYNSTGILEIDNHEAALNDYDQFSRAVEMVRTSHHEPNAVLLHPQTMGRLDRLKDTTDQPLQAPESWRGLTKLPTAQISTSMLGSPSLVAAYVAKWSEMLIGVRREIQIELTKVGAAGDESAFTKYQVWVRAVARMDVQLMRPRAFCAIKRLPGWDS